MTKGELRSMIREMIQTELTKGTALREAVEGPCYVIKAWDTPDKKGLPKFDSAKAGKKYASYDELLAAMKTTELDEMGAYEITWVKSGEATK